MFPEPERLMLIRLPWGDWVDPRAVLGVQFFGEEENGWQISVMAVSSGNAFNFPSPVYETEEELDAMLEKTVRAIGGIADD